MPTDVRKYLADACDAAESVVEFLAGRTFEAYEADRLLQSALERQFLILGEALVRIRRLDPALSSRIGDLGTAIEFRNVLAHDYENVDQRIVWSTATDNVPALIGQLRALLDQLGQDLSLPPR